jgi:hypothetical protein
VVDLAGYTLVLDTLNTGKKLTKNTRLEPYQTIIAYTSDEAQASKNGKLVAGLAAAAAVAVAAAAVILKRKKK